VLPNAHERKEIHRIIMDELVYSIPKPEAIAYHQQEFTDERSRLRCGRARLHRHPADHELFKFPSADA